VTVEGEKIVSESRGKSGLSVVVHIFSFILDKLGALHSSPFK